MYTLMAVCLVVMVGNVKAEQSFSIKNRIKTTSRSNLKTDQLDRLIRIQYREFSIEKFPFDRAAMAYLRAAWRKLGFKIIMTSED